MIKSEAQKADLDPKLVYAICMTESSLRPEVTRFEPAFKYLLTPALFAEKLGIELEEEIKDQKTSFGLMQLMGACAREHSFQGNLSELLHPDVGLHYGCMHLKKFVKKYAKQGDAIASYNAGSPRIKDGQYENQKYVDKVLKAYASSPDF